MFDVVSRLRELLWAHVTFAGVGVPLELQGEDVGKDRSGFGGSAQVWLEHRFWDDSLS